MYSFARSTTSRYCVRREVREPLGEFVNLDAGALLGRGRDEALGGRVGRRRRTEEKGHQFIQSFERPMVDAGGIVALDDSEYHHGGGVAKVVTDQGRVGKGEIDVGPGGLGCLVPGAVRGGARSRR